MASKIDVLNMPEYGQYIMIAMIQVARNILAEAVNTPFHDKRLVQARQILTDPSSKVNTFKSIVLVTFDASNYENLTEAQKITGATNLVANVFNEATYIF